MTHPSRPHNYLVFSDVHLGADLVQHVRPWTAERLRQVARIDRDLAGLLDHYRAHRDPSHPWTLIIAGDLVDFIGMSIAPEPGSAAWEALSVEERENGLGSRREHAVTKMAAVARRHRLVFERLAAFVADGHRLVLVRGNHDVDFHWTAARDAFVAAVVDAHAGDDASARELAARIEFHPWFYWVEGLLWVEHGHQYDAMCSYAHLLAPVDTGDPDRIHWSVSDLLLRRVARPTPGMSSEGHESRGLWSYLRLGGVLGPSGSLALLGRYFGAIGAAIKKARLGASSAAHRVRSIHERRMARLAANVRLGLDELRALTGLWAAPMNRGILSVLRSVLLDQVLAGTLAAFVGIALAWLLPWELGVPIAVALGAAAAGAIFASARTRKREFDAPSVMERAAESIASRVRARFVVMGHTHEPVVRHFPSGATFFNVGHWGVDDLDGATSEPTRTHLVIRWHEGEPRAELLAWDPASGPRPHR